jgi:hypothetical protein
LLLRQRRRPAEAKNQHTYGELRVHEDPPVWKDWLCSTLVEVWRASRPMREIAIDTRTTGLDPLNGDRVVYKIRGNGRAPVIMGRGLDD